MIGQREIVAAMLKDADEQARASIREAARWRSHAEALAERNEALLLAASGDVRALNATLNLREARISELERDIHALGLKYAGERVRREQAEGKLKLIVARQAEET